MSGGCQEFQEEENMQREFLQTGYIGSDGDNCRKEFVEYLEQVLINRRWDAMSDHALYLQGAKRAIEEIIWIICKGEMVCCE